MLFDKKKKKTPNHNEQHRQRRSETNQMFGSKVRNNIILIGTIITIVAAIPTLTEIFRQLELSQEYQSLSFLLGMVFIYLLVIINATAKQDTIDFIPTTATRYRFLFALFLIFYVYFLGDNFINLTALRILIFLFISYCSFLSIWIFQANYVKYRRTRTIIDIFITSLFIIFCGDPHLIFFISLLIPVTVISRHFNFKEMPQWIGLAIGSYMFAIFLNIKIFDSVSSVRGLNYILNFDQMNFNEYVTILYFEVLFIILISLIYWSERKREERKYDFVSNIYSLDMQHSNLNKLIHSLCEYLGIQVGLVIKSDQKTMILLGGSSLDPRYIIDSQNKLVIAKYPYLKDLLEKTKKQVDYEIGYDSNLKSEIIINGLIDDRSLLDTKQASYYCNKIYTSDDQLLHLLFLNKVTPNRKIVREFEAKDHDVIKSIAPKIVKIVNL